MTEAPDPREDEECPSSKVCGGICDQHYDTRGPCTCPSNCEIHGKAKGSAGSEPPDELTAAIAQAIAHLVGDWEPDDGAYDIARAALVPVRAHYAAKLEGLAAEWATEGPSLIKHAHSARDVHEGSTLEKCADELRTLAARLGVHGPTTKEG